MTQVGSGEVAVFPTFKGFRSETVREVDSTASEAGGKFSSVFGSAIKGIGVGVAAAVGASIGAIAAIAGKGLSRALNIQDAKAQLVGLGNSAENVDAIMANALDSVRGTAFGLDAAATIAASSVAAGIKPGEALTRTLKLTADAATIGKSSLSEMGDMVNKVATNGKLTTEVLQQFQGRGIPLLQMVADQYGVTAEAAAKMVTDGKVDFETFQTALEKGVGGAALSSGSTARGAFANIGAAFSRMGALFVGSAVDGAPSLFTSIAGAVDRATTALTPFAAEFSARVTPAMAALGAWIDKIDFDKIVNGLKEFYLGAVDVKDLLLTGFTENETLLPPDVVAGLQTAHDVFVGIGGAVRDAISSFQSGDFSGPMASIQQSLTTLGPAFSEFGAQMPKIGGAVAELGAAVIPVLTGALGFLADHVDTIIDFMPLIVAGFVAWRLATSATAGASIALRTAEVAALPGQILRNTLRLASAGIEYKVAAATRASTAAEVGATGARNGGIVANIRAAASTVAARAAMVAGAVATGIATAAQWALNAAMSANPIALIVIAIAALVAGLIWFFTQTELGQDIWANFTQFIGEAMENIRLAFVAVIDWIVANWPLLLAILTGPIGLLVLLIVSNFDAIVAFFVGFGATVADIFNQVIAFLLDVFFRFTPLGLIIANFGGIVQFFVDLWTNVTGAISTGIDTAVGFFTSLPDRAMAALANLGTLLVTSGADLIQGFIDGITGALGGVGDAVGGVLDFAAGFFPHSPAKRGPFSGSGWTAIGKSGQSIVDEFNSGFPKDSLQLGGTFAAALPAQRAGSSATTDAAAAVAGPSIALHVSTIEGQSNREIAEIAAYEINEKIWNS